MGPQWALTHTENTHSAADDQREGVFDAVMVCNGHYARPRNPEVPADGFEGQLMHAHNYRNPATFAGLRVMVVGAANSGTDLALEIGSVAREVGVLAVKK